MGNEVDDFLNSLSPRQEDKKPPSEVDAFLSSLGSDKKQEAGWMPTWLKHGLVGGVSDLLSQASMSDPATMGNAITSEQAQHEIESQFTGAAPEPEGFWGRGAAGVTRAMTHPASWIGPGGPLAKAAYITAGGYGGEVGGTLAEKAGAGPVGQTVARVVGSVLPAAGAGVAGAMRATRKAAQAAAAEQAAAADRVTAANQAASREFDINTSRAKASGDPEAIRYNDMAARGAHGEPARELAVAASEKEFQEFQNANRTIGEGLAGGYDAAENPSQAAARINAELNARGEQARAAVKAAEDAAAREADAARRAVEEQGRAISSRVSEGRPSIENPREAGEIVGQAVRSAAARDRANYQNLYDEAFKLPGRFEGGAFEGIGPRIQGRLTFSHDPVPIDDVLTPASSKAIRYLENVSGLRFQNRAHPLSEPPYGAPNPENTLAPVVPVDLRNVDQVRKTLVAYYSAARRSRNATDARAAGKIIDEFDNEIEQAVANGLFSGDPRVLDALGQGRAAFSRYQRQFRPQQAGDDVGLAMRRIIDRNATPEEIANMIVGSGRIGDKGLPVRLSGRLEEILGRDSEPWSAIQEAIWQKASRVRGEPGGVNTQGIDDLVGSSLGRRVFHPDALDAMRAHSAGVRTLEQTIENLESTRNVKRAQDEYQRMFGGQDIGGQPGRVFRRIIDGTATPEETVQGVFSAIKGDPGNAHRVIGAIENIVGRDSETMALLRVEVWRRVTQNAATKDQPGYQKVSEAIGELLHGKGRSIANALYTAEDIARMERYQGVVKRLVIPKFARVNSDTAPAMMQMLRNYGSAITTALGHGVDKVAGKVVGSAVRSVIKGTANVIGDARSAQKVQRSLSQIDLPPPTSTTPRPERSPLIETLSRGLAIRGGFAWGGRTEKPSKAQTHYRLGSRRRRCEICTMFRPPHTCTAIVGKVSKIGLCDLFERKKAYAEGGEVIDDEGDDLRARAVLDKRNESTHWTPEPPPPPITGSFMGTPRRIMADNPHPEGSEEAQWYDTQNANQMREFVPEAIMSMFGGAPKGALGIFGGRAAVTADQSALRLAETMAKKQFPREAIWKKTGWFQGQDGQWRFEIPDIKAQAEAGHWSTASGKMSHPDLYGGGGAYQDMAAIPIDYDAPVGQAVYYAPIKGHRTESIGMPREDYFKGSIPEIAYLNRQHDKETLLHELQHAVQNREGFTPGTSPDHPKIIKQAAKAAADAGRPERANVIANQIYWRNLAEVEARNVELRAQKATELERLTKGAGYKWLKDNPPWTTMSVPAEQQWPRPQARLSDLAEVINQIMNARRSGYAEGGEVADTEEPLPEAPIDVADERMREAIMDVMARQRAQSTHSIPEPPPRPISGSFMGTPKRILAPNPYPEGSEEAQWYETQNANQMREFVPDAIMAMAGAGAPKGAIGVAGGRTIIPARVQATPEAITRAARETAREGITQPGLRTLYGELGLTGGPPAEIARPSLAVQATPEAVQSAITLKLADREVLGTLSKAQRQEYVEKGKLPEGVMLPSKEAMREALDAYKPVKKEILRAEELFDAGNQPAPLFDLSPQTLMRTPDVPQFPLPRVAPGITERLASVPRGGMRRLETAAGNAPLENWGWYNLMQSRALMRAIHGPQKGDQAFNAYLDGLAGTSMVNPIDNNLRSATWYLQQILQGKQLPEVVRFPAPDSGKTLKALAGAPPPGYGAKSQVQHADRVRQFLTYTFDPAANPKPISYRQNLGGNWMPRTVDTHDIRNMVGMPRALELFGENGALLPKEYAYLEALGQRAANRAGRAQAPQQAATWVGGGDYTGLKSYPAPLEAALNRRAIVTAQVRGISPEQALHDAFSGKAPLLGLGGLGLLAPGMKDGLLSAEGPARHQEYN